MHFLNAVDCAAVGGGVSTNPPIAAVRMLTAIPEPLPGLPYPGPGLASS